MGIDPDNFQGDEFWQAYMDSGEEACARGAWLEAERLFEFAIHEAERLSDRQRLVASLERQADAAHRSGNHAKSAEAIKKALELKRVDSDQEPDQVVAQLCQMALAEVDNENYPKAEALYKEAMAIVENAPAKIEPATHRLTLSSLARLYLALGHLDEAQRFFRLAIEVVVGTALQKTGEHAEDLNGLASVYTLQHDHKRALPRLESSLSILEQTRAPVKQIIVQLRRLGEALKAVGEQEESLSAYERALACIESSESRDPALLVATMTDLAGVYEDTGRMEEAMELYQRTFASSQEIGILDLGIIAKNLTRAASFYDRQGKPDKAEPIYLHCLRILEKSYDLDHIGLVPVISRLGRIYFQEKNYLESERFLLRALEIQERQLGAEHPDLEENYLILHSVYQALARPENDERILRHLLALLCNQLGENHPRVGKTLLELAHVYSFLGALEEAEPVYERALGILRPVLKGPDAQVQAAEEELARIKAGREKVKPESGFERLLRWFGVD